MKSSQLQQDLAHLANYISQMGFSGTTFLVTGATGLIGSLVVKSLLFYNSIYSKQYKIIAMARSKEKVKEIYGDTLDENNCSQITFIYQDICDPISEEIECDYIVHTANPTVSKQFMTNPVEVLNSIYIGTCNVLEYSRKTHIQAMVYLSSMEVFGQVYCEERISEHQLGYIDLQNVRSCYSEGKRLAECLCACYAQEYDVPVRVARLAQTFGAGILPGENRVFAQFARSALDGENIVLHTDGSSMGNYCYTTDAIRAIYLLLKKGENGQAYTVVNETTTMSIAQMAQLVADNFSTGNTRVVFDIVQDNSKGYAPKTKMRLSSEKLRSLGWTPEIDLIEAYKRMLSDLH